jgi:hypothetical protein
MIWSDLTSAFLLPHSKCPPLRSLLRAITVPECRGKIRSIRKVSLLMMEGEVQE